ncbi:MAG: glutamate--cysteine ligase [Bacteriovoracaceae bacterium]|jgi:glutamate--cysteine ligase|nr:glutamate--cysteine ligase [Bacteriovoracaceae bacterium]
MEFEKGFLEKNIFQGIERECLRVSEDGKISKNFHQEALGAKLTHEYITTDYAEALLEFITKVHNKTEDLYNELLEIHKNTYENIGDEFLWPFSMPCILPEDQNDIAVADYGSSHIGNLKKVYRIGLGHRYGRRMQSIAGVHYNFSLSDLFWKKYQDENEIESLQKAKEVGYFHIIRNYKRYQWVLSYLFGASPCVDKSFLVENNRHSLEQNTSNTYVNKQATSLRMGGLGYTSSEQDKIVVCYNTLKTYIETLEKARLESISKYEKIGLQSKDGSFKQLNSNLLQIDNEFYSTIRPKAVAKSGQSALMALNENGIEYIEIRILDVNPFDPVGISSHQIKFLHLFLTTMLFLDSPFFELSDFNMAKEELDQVVKHGLNRPLKEKLNILYKSMEENLTLFSEQYALSYYKIKNAHWTFSEKVVQQLSENDFIEFGIKLGLLHKRKILNSNIIKKIDFEFHRTESIRKLRQIESHTEGNFFDFLTHYFENIKIQEFK